VIKGALIPLYAKVLIGLSVVIAVLLSVIAYSLFISNRNEHVHHILRAQHAHVDVQEGASSQMPATADSTATPAEGAASVPEYLDDYNDQSKARWLAKYITIRVKSCAPGMYNWPSAVIEVHNSSTSFVDIFISVGFKNTTDVYFTTGIAEPEVPANSTVLSTITGSSSDYDSFKCEIINKDIGPMTKGP